MEYKETSTTKTEINTFTKNQHDRVQLNEDNNAKGSSNKSKLQIIESGFHEDPTTATYTVTPNVNVSIVSGDEADICKFNGGAIVNAANNKCIDGGGVDGAIHIAAGAVYKDDIKHLSIYPGTHDTRCMTGVAQIVPIQTVIDFPTIGCIQLPYINNQLMVHRIIQVAGPQCLGTSNDTFKTDLRNAYTSSLVLAFDHGLHSIAFPAISCGVYACSSEDSATACANAIQDVSTMAKYKDIKMNVFIFLQSTTSKAPSLYTDFTAAFTRTFTTPLVIGGALSRPSRPRHQKKMVGPL